MRNIALLALSATLSTAAAATVSGSQSTPLTVNVKNVCITAYTNPGYNGAAGMGRTWDKIDLGTVSAISNNVTADKLVMAVDCNYDTALKIITPTSVTMTRADKKYSFNITTNPWSATNPMHMSFSTAGSYEPGMLGGKYEYYEVKASFKLGGAGQNPNVAWTIPGGTYTGDMVVKFEYNE